MDLRRDRKHSLKFREMLETQGYAQAQDPEEREAWPVKDKCTIVLTGLYPGPGVKTAELIHTSQSQGGV